MAFYGSGKWMAKAFKQKAMESFKNEHPDNLVRNLSLFDLICVGVGATVGSGVFVLTGFVANKFAGPGVIISWIIAGIACTCSAMSYAELSCRIPSSGSAYSYVYLALGEWPAFIAGWCLTLECGISGAAVARTWGVKMTDLIVNWGRSKDDFVFSSDNLGPNWYAGGIQLIVVIIFLCGVDVSKFTVNLFTVLKMVLVLFIIVCGFTAFKAENIQVFAPMGVTGIMRGATACFFGFVGYDEVCCMAFETINPQRNIPMSIFTTILMVTVFYCLASLALVGMTPISDIDLQNGFSMAFHQNGMTTIAHITALGELFMLPIVVLVSFLAQPRLQLAMALDGLLPSGFGEINSRGNLFKGILYSGILCTLVALLVPFSYLDDMVSAGVLFSFNLTNMALIVIRCGGPSGGPLDGDEPYVSNLFPRQRDDSESDVEISGVSVIHTDNSNNSNRSAVHCNTYSTSYSTSGWSYRLQRLCRLLVTVPRFSYSRCKNLLVLFCLYSILTSSLLANLNFTVDNDEVVFRNTVLVLLPALGMIYTAVNLYSTCPQVSWAESEALQAGRTDRCSSLSMLYSSGMVTPLRPEHHPHHDIASATTTTPGAVGGLSPIKHPLHSSNGGYTQIEMHSLHGGGGVVEDMESHLSTPPPRAPYHQQQQQHVTPPPPFPAHLSTPPGPGASGNTFVSDDTDEFDLDYYHVPFMPFVPLFGIFINFYLVCQLSTRGLLLIIGSVVFFTLFYFCYSMHHSILNTKMNNSHSIEELEHIYHTSGPLPTGTSFTPPRKSAADVSDAAAATVHSVRNPLANGFDIGHSNGSGGSVLETPPRRAVPTALPGSRRRGYDTVPKSEDEK